MIALWFGLVFADPLTLDEVLGAVDERLPPLIAADADVQAALAAEMGARTPFDVDWSASIGDLQGYYDNTRASVYLGTESIIGPKLSAGWRIGRGNFADYDGKPETLDGGEFFASVAVPLTDLGQTKSWAKARAATQKRRAVESKRVDVLRKVRLKAASQYWAWVQAGRLLQIERDLLERARTRAAGLQRQLDEGSVARIAWLDNEQVVASRSAKVASSEAKLASEALKLGVYYRDIYGEPIVPTEDDLPQRGELPVEPTVDLEEAVRTAWANRPDLAAADAMIDAASVTAARARRDMLPDINAYVGVSRDVGEGSDTLDPTTLSSGLSIDGSLLWRGERAALREASAELRALEADRRWLQDQISAEVLAVHQRRVAAVQQWRDALRALEVAEELLVLERRRLELGGSDVFRLVLREEKALSAAKAVAEAEATYGALQAAWAAALGEPAQP